MSQTDLTRLRVEYGKQSLSESDVDPNPIRQLTRWLDEAIAAKVNEPNAMTLATCSAHRPSARIVLLKGIDADGLVFCTNYQSRKGIQIEHNPHAALVFWWPELERQVRVEGTLTLTTPEESADQFNRRPPSARIAAAASQQSRTIASRADLERRFTELTEKYPDGNIPRPPHWGGYRLRPLSIEFWQGRRSRLHDRLEFTWNQNTGWVMCRLAP